MTRRAGTLKTRVGATAEDESRTFLKPPPCSGALPKALNMAQTDQMSRLVGIGGGAEHSPADGRGAALAGFPGQAAFS